MQIKIKRERSGEEIGGNRRKGECKVEKEETDKREKGKMMLMKWKLSEK